MFSVAAATTTTTINEISQSDACIRCEFAHLLILITPCQSLFMLNIQKPNNLLKKKQQTIVCEKTTKSKSNKTTKMLKHK